MDANYTENNSVNYCTIRIKSSIFASSFTVVCNKVNKKMCLSNLCKA
nr:MAG TPA: hypothetical protein [Caudoviricetes sp.]